MSSLRTQHREFLSWLQDPQQLDTVDQYGYAFSGVCLFWFNIQSDGTLTGAFSDEVLQEAMERSRRLKEKWPQIRWLLTIKNDGFSSRIDPIIENQAGEQDQLISEVHRLLDQYPWVDGLDADLERLPNDQMEGIYQFYNRLYEEIKGRSSSRFLHLDLPPMTGPYETIGPERWCAYERLVDCCDTAQIMTYGYAWAGSAPGSTAPLDWQRRVMTYATQAFRADQVFMGVPAYGYRWQISEYPNNTDDTYRGFGGGFPAFLRWMVGDLSHTDSYRGGAETQPYIPFFSFFDERDQVHQLLLHVYDYVDAGEDEDQTDLNRGTYEEKPFLTAYDKQQQTTFEGLVTEKKASDAVTVEGAMVQGETYVSPRKPTEGESEGYAKWIFTLSERKTVELVAHVEFPWFDQQRLMVNIDGNAHVIGDVPQYYPYHRRKHWTSVTRLTLDAGEHVVELLGQGSQYGTIFYGFRVCEAFYESNEAGEATFTLHPRRFVDRDGQPAWPYQDRFRITLETIRRPPEPALIFYDDFRDWQGHLPSDKYVIQAGSWKVNREDDPGPRPYAWVTGKGQFSLSHDHFSNIVADARVRLQARGKAGVTVGNLWFCLNLNYQGGRYELYQDSTLLADRWPNGSLELNQYYRLRLRVKENVVTCYLGDVAVIQHTLSDTVTGAWGIRSDAEMSCDLLVGADSYWYFPQEALDIQLPDGTVQTVGRIPRTGVTWHKDWGLFRVENGEEWDTRLEPEDGMDKQISKDWFYLHTSNMTLTEGDYPIRIKMRDQGVWLGRVYLGDADGFSLAVFPSPETILKQSDIAAYEFQVRGIGMWAVGQEDPQLWQMLVDHSEKTS